MRNPDDLPPESGLSALYEIHRAELRRFIAARTGNPFDADDILQEVWLRLRAEPTRPVANGRAYLYRVAQNLILDRLRLARRRAARERDWADVELGQHPGGLEPRTDQDADAALIEQENVARLARAVAALPPGAGRVFRLHKLEGLSQVETAAQLGITRKTVEKHMTAALAQLRRALKEEVG